MGPPPPPRGFTVSRPAIDSKLPAEEQDRIRAELDRLQKEREEAAEKASSEAREKEEKRVAEFNEWANSERKRYADEITRVQDSAQKSADQRVPQTLDISLLGGGWIFILEFSTVIVIIFILLCLGILGAVSGQQTITILASIAGYVLGKASANAQRHPDGSGASAPQLPPNQ
jgi:hypothetical protein